MNITKAQMLIDLKSNISNINILPIYVVNSTDLVDNKWQVITDIMEFANGKGRNIIVRSSSVNEDTSEYSNAGRFESVLNVEPNAEILNRR